MFRALPFLSRIQLPTGNIAAVVDSARLRPDFARPSDAHDSYGAGGEQFQPSRTVEEERGARISHAWGLRGATASVLFWFLLGGGGAAGGVGQWGVSGGVYDCAVEVF